FAALSLSGRAVLRRRVEPDNGSPVGLPKRQAEGLWCGVRIVSTFDNIDNWTPTRQPAALLVRAVLRPTGATRSTTATVRRVDLTQGFVSLRDPKRVGRACGVPLC